MFCFVIISTVRSSSDLVRLPGSPGPFKQRISQESFDTELSWVIRLQFAIVLPCCRTDVLLFWTWGWKSWSVLSSVQARPGQNWKFQTISKVCIVYCGSALLCSELTASKSKWRNYLTKHSKLKVKLKQYMAGQVCAISEDELNRTASSALAWLLIMISKPIIIFDGMSPSLN